MQANRSPGPAFLHLPCGGAAKSPKTRTRLPAKVIWAILVVSQMGHTVQAAGDDVTPSQARSLLERCLQVQQRTDRISVQGATEIKATEIKSGGAAPAEHSSRVEFWLRRDGKLLDISGLRLVPPKEGRKLSSRFRVVAAKEVFVLYSVRIPLEKVTGGTAYMKDAEAHRMGLFDVPDYSLPLDGYFPSTDGNRLASLVLDLDDAKAGAREEIDGVPCVPVRGATKYGTIAMWIATSAPFTVVKASLEKKSGDLSSHGVRLSDPPTGKQRTMRDWLMVLDKVTVSESAQQKERVPVSGRLTHTVRVSDGTLITMVFTFKRTDVVLQPDFKGTDAFQIDLPDGAPITNMDDPDSGVEYRWKQGNVVRVSGDSSSGERARKGDH